MPELEDEPHDQTSWTSSGKRPERKVAAEQLPAPERNESTSPPVERPSGKTAAASAPPVADHDPDATRFSPKAAPQSGKIGLVLNNIWQVRRLVAQGGMGEVYEGFTKATSETVAIKFLLPQLAADPTIQNLFLMEARTLVKLSANANTALVQYRVCAHDPTLDETYIVMEFVDGPTLGQALPN